MCSHMLLADLGYVVTSFCDLDCRMDCPMPCNNNISNIYGLNCDTMTKWLFVKKRMKWNCTFAWEANFQTVVCRSSDSGVHCRLWGKRKQYDYHCRGKRHLYKVLYLHSRIPRGLNRGRLKISDRVWYSLSTLTKGICCFLLLWHNMHGSAIWADNLLTSKRGGKTKCVHPNAICSIARSYSNELCWLQNKALENQCPTESIFSCWHHIFKLFFSFFCLQLF